MTNLELTSSTLPNLEDTLGTETFWQPESETPSRIVAMQKTVMLRFRILEIIEYAPYNSFLLGKYTGKHDVMVCAGRILPLKQN